MFPPKRNADWQAFAKGIFPMAKGFAQTRFGRRMNGQGAAFVPSCPLLSDVSLSSPFRSVPVHRGGPDLSFPLRQGDADLLIGDRANRKFLFRARRIGVISACKTSLRGSYPCVNPLSPSLLFRSPLWQAACRTPLRAVWLALLPVRQSLTSPTATWQPAPSSAVWLARQAAPCRVSADRLTTPAFGRIDASLGPSGQIARMAFSYSATAFWPGRDPRGERCSRRS